MNRENSTKVASSAGRGFSGLATLLTVAFIVLKLCKVITWSWVWVLSPLWIEFALGFIVSIIVIIVAIVVKVVIKKR